jgi:hypothetical protein
MRKSRTAGPARRQAQQGCNEQETPDRDRRAGACTIIGSACLAGRPPCHTRPVTDRTTRRRPIHPSACRRNGSTTQNSFARTGSWNKKNPPLITDRDPNGPNHPWGLGQADRSCMPWKAWIIYASTHLASRRQQRPLLSLLSLSLSVQLAIL